MSQNGLLIADSEEVEGWYLLERDPWRSRAPLAAQRQVNFAEDDDAAKLRRIRLVPAPAEVEEW